ncbi:MAG: hypothetical protein IJW59_02440 [Clostridia bacterium]|nr:hypothetical protein [Clostridia bacterium]
MSNYEKLKSPQSHNFPSSGSGEFNENVPSVSCDDTSDDLVQETYPLVTPLASVSKKKEKETKSNGVCCIMTILVILTLSIIIFIVVLVLIFLYLLFNHYI